MTKRYWLALPVATALTGASPAMAGKTVEADLQLGAALHLDVESSGCSNRGGPYIKILGDLLTGGVHVKLRAENAGGVHGDEVDATLSVKLSDPTGKEIKIPKQPPVRFDGGGAGGNPWIFFQPTDTDGEALAPAVLLGRCVQGLFNVNSLFAVLGHATGEVEGSCQNHPRSTITIEGSLIAGGIDGNIIFANQDSLDARHTREELGRLTFEIVPEGGGVIWPKQPFKDVDGDGEGDGVTGNPLLYLQFVDEDGLGLDRELRLGRCNKL